jgi:hypothetical protein
VLPEIDLQDPAAIGFDREQHAGIAQFTVESQTLDYSSSGTDSASLSKDRLITTMMLVADPYRHDVTTAAITVVEDAADKLISALTIAGGVTYVGFSSTLMYLKALGAMNKVVYGSSVGHQDLATAVAADNDSYQNWVLPFGAFNDHDYFDITAGIPAALLNTLNLDVTFGANNIIAATAANGTVDASTDVYVVTIGVQNLGEDYLRRVPIPNWSADHKTSVQSTETFELLGNRFLKRSTLINLGVAASNNEPRNDSNINNFTIEFLKPSTSQLINRARWRVTKNLLSPMSRMPGIDRDGAAAIVTTPLPGVAVIDWRRLTKNPYGLNLYGAQDGDARLRLELGTTTGSIHLLNEYYTAPDPSVYEGWPAWRPD